MGKMLAPIVAFALVSGLVGPIVVQAEIISVPPATPSDPAASLSPPTVLRGSPPAPARSVPICPPGYTFSSDYGCVAPSGGDYTEAGPSYDYWPGYGFGLPFDWFPGFDHRAARSHRFVGFHAGHRFHGRVSFHSAAKFGTFGAGIGHMGGFGRR
jgi:hypothetical protein